MLFDQYDHINNLLLGQNDHILPYYSQNLVFKQIQKTAKPRSQMQHIEEYLRVHILYMYYIWYIEYLKKFGNRL